MSGLDSRSHDINDADCAYVPHTRPAGIQTRGNLVTSLAMLITRRWRRQAMVYVERDAQGRLLRVEQQPFEGAEHMAVESEELQNWLRVKEEVKARLDSLNSSDLELVRVLEDVIIVLVDRGVIQYTDLPAAARDKLDQRAVARADLEGLNTILREAGE
ncbi:MAG TPA: hypothetical protein VIM59_13875 [Cellvibrio sp.]